MFVPFPPSSPVYDGYFADPFVFSHDGTYYAVGTGPASDDAEFPLLASEDLVHWRKLGWALPRIESGWQFYWAPEVAICGGRFYLYYSVGRSNESHQLRVAVSSQPAGPYRQEPEPVLNPSATPFAIDPSPFRDVDGTWYLFYSRDFLDSVGGTRPGTSIVVAKMSDMRRISEEFTTVARARHDWQRYEADRGIYGGIYDWHTIEGAAILRRGDRYYCFYSGGNWQNTTYGVDFVEADSILGPWVDANPGDGPRILRSRPPHLLGPGHNSFFTDHFGSLHIAYHAWDPEMTLRQLYISRVQ